MFLILFISNYGQGFIFIFYFGKFTIYTFWYFYMGIYFLFFIFIVQCHSKCKTITYFNGYVSQKMDRGQSKLPIIIVQEIFQHSFVKAFIYHGG